MDIGNRIREARILKGFTINQLAKITKITRSQISNYELGQFEPSQEILVKLSTALCVTPGYFSMGKIGEKFAQFEGLTHEDQEKVIEYIRVLKKVRMFDQLINHV